MTGKPPADVSTVNATCMAGSRQAGGPCGAPATYRRGVRCPNGCYGEGEFEYGCDSHTSARRVNKGTCAQCGSEVELFAVQAVIA